MNGGAVYNDYGITVWNSTFKSNTANEYGGAIYGSDAIYINDKHQSSEPISFFIDNKAKEYGGGAIYSNGNANIYSAYFYGNKACTDGGAVDTSSHCYVYDSIFDSNRAESAKVQRCWGGAINSWEEANVYSCKFVNNFAENSGGAIHAKTAALYGNPSYFENNVAYKSQGGAIYAGSFKDDILSGIFIGNKAGEGAVSSDDGGAIYISNEQMDVLTISGCVFINNYCTDEGGAIYVDTSDDRIKLIYNVFSGNRAGDKGQIVYNCGDYDAVEYNWYGLNDPSFSDQFKEYHALRSDTDYSVSNYAKLNVKLDATEIYKNSPYSASIYYTDNNNNPLSNQIPIYGLEFTEYGANYSDLQEGSNQVIFEVVFLENDGKLKLHLNSQDLYIAPSDIKDKNVTSVIIYSCDDIADIEDLHVYFNIDGITDPVYVIKDNEGNIVKQGNIIGKNDFTVSGLSSGFYSLTIINPEGQTSLSSSATVKFVVYTDVNAKISADNRIYGQPTTFNMTSDVDGIYIIDIIGYGKIQINVINGTGTKQAYLPVGEYRTVTSVECGYYRLDCKEVSFEVEPSEISIYFEELYDVVYPNNIHGYILTDISGGLWINYRNKDTEDLFGWGVLLHNWWKFGCCNIYYNC